MTILALPDVSDRQAADGPRAGESHGLTKKFGPDEMARTGDAGAIECSERDRAGALLGGTTPGAPTDINAQGLTITRPSGTARPVIAELNRVLLDGGISVDRRQENQASLAPWFLSVTNRPRAAQ